MEKVVGLTISAGISRPGMGASLAILIDALGCQ